MKSGDILNKKNSALFLLAFCSFFIVEQSNAAIAHPKTINPGKLTIGSDLTYPPYYYTTKSGKAAGFGPKMMRAIAHELNLKPKFVNTRFSQLIVRLKSHRFDVVASAMYITKKRAQTVDYVPLFQTGDSLISLKGSKYQPAKPKELCGHTVGVIKGASVIPKLHKSAKSVCANGKKITVKQFPTAPSASQALLAQAVDVQIADAAVSKRIVKKSQRLKITSNKILYPVNVGLAVTKGNTGMQNALEKAVNKLKNNGKYMSLLKEYNLQPPNKAMLKKTIPGYIKTHSN